MTVERNGGVLLPPVKRDDIEPKVAELALLRLALEQETKARQSVEARFTAPIVCMCGSTRFKQAWISENARLSLEGNTVLAVGLWGHHERKFPDVATKAQLDAWHKCKIDLCDWVWVLDVGGYLGESTRSEIEYAEKLGRPVRYLSQEFPDYVEPLDPFKEELAEIDTALDNGADEELWPPGMTRAEAICRLKAERDELREINDGTDLDECVGERDVAERERDVAHTDLMVAKAENAQLRKQLEEADVDIAWETQVVEEDLFQRLEEAEEGERIQRARAEKAQANYQFMVNRAAEEKLDGYRELGARAADAERRADQTSAALREARQWADYYERMWKTADAELERLRRENQRLLEQRNEH